MRDTASTRERRRPARVRAGDPRSHQPSRPDLERALVAEDAERFELAVQCRALHPDKGRGARDVAAEAGYLGQQILALEHLARVAQWQGHDLAALVPFDDARCDGG